MSKIRMSVKAVPVTSLAGLHPSLESIGLALLAASPRPHRIAQTAELLDVMHDYVPHLVLLSPAQCGYHVIGPPDALPLASRFGFKRVPALIVEGVTEEGIVEMAVKYWLILVVWRIHAGVPGEEVAATYCQVMESLTGARPRSKAVAKALGVSAKMIGRGAKRAKES